MILGEVNPMEKEDKNTVPEENQKDYVPRPAWQIWGARLGLVIFIGFVILQLLTIAGGGL